MGWTKGRVFFVFLALCSFLSRVRALLFFTLMRERGKDFTKMKSEGGVSG